MLELEKQLDSARLVIQADEADETAMRIALAQVDMEGALEKQYKAMLLTMIDLSLDAEAILRQCQTIQVLIFASLLVPQIPENIVDSILPYLTEFVEILEIIRGRGPQNVQLIPLTLFCELMILKQADIVHQNKQKLMHEGLQLTEDQIICPFTRKKISVSSSLVSQKSTQDFLAIFIALSRRAQLDNEQINNFLTTKPADYLQQADEKLLNYLNSPDNFPFTKQQHQFLIDIGANEAAKQMKELKNRYKDALGLLTDYNKQNWFSPSLGLFFTGHWNRHHHRIVAIAIEQLVAEENIDSVLATLETEARNDPKFNARGTLMLMLASMRAKLSGDMEEESDVVSEDKCISCF